MQTTFKKAYVYRNGKLNDLSSVVFDIPSLSNGLSFFSDSSDNSSLYGIFPGFCDAHVHLREPGFSYKETIKTGTAAAAHGGYTDVFSMPNLSPVPDCPDNMRVQTDIIKRDAVIGVHPFAALTVGEKGETLSDMAGLCDVCIGFSDDGKGVQSESLMRSAMEKAHSLGKIISAHCEDNSLLNGGYIHKGYYAELHNHKGICSESEWAPIKRDIRLAKETGCSYHVCHISSKESVQLIRNAKKNGVDITCETAPHYLTLDDSELKEDGRFKMNPPIRDKSDREALIEGILDGTIDMIATDHAPHAENEKNRGLENSLMGVSGIECAFSELYTRLVKTGTVPLELIIKLLTDNPRKRFGLKDDNSFCIWNLSDKHIIDTASFLSMGKSTPFSGDEVFGKCVLTIKAGKTVWHLK